jgi:hypothetical protein
MAFSVTVWNMQRRASGWNYLDRVLSADISLLQEVAAAPTPRPGLTKEIGGTRRWGSAIDTAIHDRALEPLDVLEPALAWFSRARASI